MSPYNSSLSSAAHVITVSSGDTLFQIAETYGTTIEALVQANGISDPNLIYVGQELQIPGTEDDAPPTAVEPSRDRIVTVSSGDTLSRIAEAHGTTVEALVQANGISDPNLIYVGQQLSIPTAETPMTSVEPSAPIDPPSPSQPVVDPPRHLHLRTNLALIKRLTLCYLRFNLEKPTAFHWRAQIDRLTPCYLIPDFWKPTVFQWIILVRLRLWRHQPVCQPLATCPIPWKVGSIM